MAEVQPQAAAAAGEMTQRFIEFVMMTAQNAAMFLGQIPHPQTGRGQVDLDTARLFIDQLEMIQEKTSGNLTAEETRILSSTLNSLHMAYVEIAARTGHPDAFSGRRPAGEEEHDRKPENPSPAVTGPSAPAPASDTPAPSPGSPAPAAEEPSENKRRFVKSYGP